MNGSEGKIVCKSCGKEVPAGSTFCGYCGAPVEGAGARPGVQPPPPPAQQPPIAPPTGGPTGPTYTQQPPPPPTGPTYPQQPPPLRQPYAPRPSTGQWWLDARVGDWVSIASAFVLFISLFLPWTRIKITFFGTNVSEAAFGPSFGWVMMISVLAVVAVFVLDVLPTNIELPFEKEWAYIGAGAFAILISLLVMLLRPLPGAVAPTGVSRMPWVGAYIGILAAIGILVGGVLLHREIG
ncbi:MAG: zinc ribbon domain-containing protein [Actinomycetota bacterium]|nr:zinc ribbon domain-containing protein [Actinomycetota bacterium]